MPRRAPEYDTDHGPLARLRWLGLPVPHYALAMDSTNSSESSASAEVHAPYGTGPAPEQAPSSEINAKPAPRVRIHHLQQAKRDGTRLAMLTAYQQ